MGKVTFITTSISEEYIVIPAIEQIIETDADIEAWVIPLGCTPDGLKKFIRKSDADVYVVSSINVDPIAYYVAGYTDAPVIGLPLKAAGESQHPILSCEGMPKKKPIATLETNDAKMAANLAIKIANVEKPTPPKKSIWDLFKSARS